TQPAGHLRAERPPDIGRLGGACDDLDFVAEALQHHSSAAQGGLQRFESSLGFAAVAAGGGLQLTLLEGAVRREEDRLESGAQLVRRHLDSTTIAPKASFCRTLTAPRRRSSSRATNVTTASSRSSLSSSISTRSTG